MREAGQLHHRGHAQPRRKVKRPKAWKAEAPNQVWSWDITDLPARVRGSWYRLYLILDIYSRKIVAWEIYTEERADHAGRLVTQACLREGVVRDQLVLHADNGSPMKGATMLATLQKLGVVPSFSRPSVSNDNPYSEALFRTLKYVPENPNEPFESLEEARGWVERFVRWYNEEHRHSGIRFVTPGQRHRGEERGLLARRKALYEAAKARHPERWSRETRNWEPVESVWLNPEHEERSSSEEGDLRKHAA